MLPKIISHKAPPLDLVPVVACLLDTQAAMAASGVTQLFELPGNILKNYNYAKWHHSYTVTESRPLHQGKHVSVKLFPATQEKLMFSSDSVSPLTHRTVSQIISALIKQDELSPFCCDFKF